MLETIKHEPPTLAEFFGLDKVDFGEVDLSKYAHLIIDPQREFTDPTYHSKDANRIRGNQRTHEASLRIASYTYKLRRNGLRQIFLYIDDKEEGFSQAYGGPYFVYPNKERDILVSKPDSDGFFRSRLEETLRENGITHLLASGFNVEVCYQKTVCFALRRGFHVAVIADGIGQDSNLPAYKQQNGMEIMEHEGALITSSEPALDMVERIAFIS